MNRVDDPLANVPDTYVKQYMQTIMQWVKSKAGPVDVKGILTSLNLPTQYARPLVTKIAKDYKREFEAIDIHTLRYRTFKHLTTVESLEAQLKLHACYTDAIIVKALGLKGLQALEQMKDVGFVRNYDTDERHWIYYGNNADSRLEGTFAKMSTSEATKKKSHKKYKWV